MTFKIVIGITITIVVGLIVKFVLIDKSKRDSSSTTQIGNKAGGDIVGRDKKTNK